MTSRFMLIFAAISGFIFVALGAFGAHVLSQSLGAAEMAWIFATVLLWVMYFYVMKDMARKLYGTNKL